MNEEEYPEIAVEQLELMAQQCSQRRGQRRRTKLKTFDSITYELEKHKLKENKQPPQPEQVEQPRDCKTKNLQNCA